MTEAHCSSCGSSDYENLYGPDADQGYTGCCSKRTCHGDGRDRFGIESDYQVACCWGVAYEKFAAAGRQVPEGSSNRGAPRR